ncbi:ABC transporter permease subunit [Cellulosimicrobium funkei]|nr:ABC transporter permease subunit [Cellulosimicrobium funkei]
MTARYWRQSARPALFGVIGVGGFLLIWQLLAVGPMAGSALPTVGQSFSALVQLLGDSSFWKDTAVTAGTALIGLVAAIVVGVVMGILIGTSQLLRFATSAVLEFLKPIPPIVILPIVVLVLGPTTEMTIVLVIIGCSIPILIQTVAGVFDVDPVRTDTARSYGMGRAEILGRVVLPGASPFIATAVRVSAPAALVVTVVAGLLGGGPGLGQSLYQAQTSGDSARMYALIIVLGILGMIFQAASQLVEAKTLHWHESKREVQA